MGVQYYKCEFDNASISYQALSMNLDNLASISDLIKLRNQNEVARELDLTSSNRVIRSKSDDGRMKLVRYEDLPDFLKNNYSSNITEGTFDLVEGITFLPKDIENFTKSRRHRKIEEALSNPVLIGLFEDEELISMAFNQSQEIPTLGIYLGNCHEKSETQSVLGLTSIGSRETHSLRNCIHYKSMGYHPAHSNLIGMRRN